MNALPQSRGTATEPLSDEQKAVVGADLVPISVIACAGSGKTRTAVHRLAEVRNRLGSDRGYATLLSFSNVAVNTFRRDYEKHIANVKAPDPGARICIETVDSFITANILRPHAHKIMQAKASAFLVTGNEPFLDGFKFFDGNYSREITDLKVDFCAGEPKFCYEVYGKRTYLDTASVINVVSRLGQVGAYTHELGRYWAYRTLRELPGILRALARRYPHIIIDEAQDIGPTHEAILEQLVAKGVKVTLIGDPNQAIYEFAGSTGAFLTGYGARIGVYSYGLTLNYRSVPEIVAAANVISGRNDKSCRTPTSPLSGAYFVSYEVDEDEERLIEAFQETLVKAGLNREQSVVLCRNRDLTNKIKGTTVAVGKGVAKKLVIASLLRDERFDYMGAYKETLESVVSLLRKTPPGLISQCMSMSRDDGARLLRKLVWAFVRNPQSGLPSATLIANAEWHKETVARIKHLLNTICQRFQYEMVENLGQRITKANLPSSPLLTSTISKPAQNIRIDTVHQAKGESLDAVLYLATSSNVQAFIDGGQTELGRIGYVALTRARELFWLAVPNSSTKAVKTRLLALGFQERII